MSETVGVFDELIIDQMAYVAASDKDPAEAGAEYADVLLYLAEIDRERMARSKNIMQYNLPEIPEHAAFEVAEAIEASERSIVAPHLNIMDYDNGTAEEDNQILVDVAYSDLLITAEHATTHMRKGKRKEADFGVAGLGFTLSSALAGGLIVARGKQTGDANHDEIHPIKAKMTETISLRAISNFISLHGLGPGRFFDPIDPKAFDALLGIGNNPTDATLEFTEVVKDVASTYDLNVGVNTPYVQVDPKTRRVKRKTDGTVATLTLAAAGKGTTRAHAQKIMTQQRIDDAVAVQFELSPLLRYMPEGSQFHRDRVAQAMGLYVGFKLIHDSLVHIGIK